MKAILYRRVSKADGSQQTENQRLALEAWKTSRADIEVIADIHDEESTRRTRPGKEQALRLLRSGQADTIVVAKLDRWARSTSEFTMELDEAVARGWNFVSISDGIDLSTPSGRAMVRMMAVFAELERDLIRDRTLAGLIRARAQGKKLGRPVGSKDSAPRRRSGYLMREERKRKYKVA